MHNNIKYPKEPDKFLSETKSAVNNYFSKNNISKFGGSEIIQKNLIIASTLCCIYLISIIFHGNFITPLCYALMGMTTIVLAINVVHDAVHEVAHSNKRINNLLMQQMDILGPNSFIWKSRHQTGHHTFPNILDHDPDLKQSVLARIFPNSPKFNFHKYQHIYIPMLYAFYSINWIFIRDFRDAIELIILKKIPRIEILRFLFFKSLYISIFVFFPIFHFNLAWQLVLISNIAMHFSASYFLTIALIPSHVCEHSYFPQPDQNGILPYSWSHHQVMTTSDYATKSKLMTWLLGGFNHHVVHHLFPEVSHVHYYQLTPLVINNISKFGLPYQHVNSIFDAYKSHFQLLKNNGSK